MGWTASTEGEGLRASRVTGMPAANQRHSLLDEMRRQYEAARVPTHIDDVENFESIDARSREAFRGLDQAITYLNAIKPAIKHRFDLG